ncbi:hypothetical protein, partial [Fervidobacterium sp.]
VISNNVSLSSYHPIPSTHIGIAFLTGRSMSSRMTKSACFGFLFAPPVSKRIPLKIKSAFALSFSANSVPRFFKAKATKASRKFPVSASRTL